MHATRRFQAVDAPRAIPDIVRKRAPARSRRVATALACLLLGACGASSSSSSNADGASQSPPDASQTVTQALSFETNAGVTLHATIRGTGDLRARPLIIQISPYGAGRDIPDFAPAYNHILVTARGPGTSRGVWPAGDRKGVWKEKK